MGEKMPQQERAAHALNRITALNDSASGKTKKAYRAYIASFPATIVMNGLGQAVATWMAATKEGREGTPAAYKATLEHLEDWLCKEAPHSPYRVPSHQPAGKPGLMLMRELCSKDQNDYLAAQTEALFYLEWLKKFANALLDETDGKDAGKQG
jgi:CRISPR-associated protein Cmr5